MVAACGIWCFGFQFVGMVWSWGLCVRFAAAYHDSPLVRLIIGEFVYFMCILLLLVRVFGFLYCFYLVVCKNVGFGCLRVCVVLYII